MHINIQKLKGKMAEENISANELSNAIGVNKTTFYRKLREGGGKFTVEQIQGIATKLSMTPNEAMNIFLGQYSH